MFSDARASRGMPWVTLQPDSASSRCSNAGGIRAHGRAACRRSGVGPTSLHAARHASKIIRRNAMEQVLAAVRTGPSRTEIKEFPMPDIPADAALMRVEVGGICGTDVKLYK